MHTQSWSVQPTKIFLAYLADMTTGYCGSDLQALCAEAVMSCLRRSYPDIHKSKVSIKARNLKVTFLLICFCIIIKFNNFRWKKVIS